MACVCPSCGSQKSQVRDTDSKSFAVTVKRIRQCCDCSRRFETWEGVDNRDIKVQIAQLSRRLERVSSQVLKAGSDVLDVQTLLETIVE